MSRSTFLPFLQKGRRRLVTGHADRSTLFFFCLASLFPLSPKLNFVIPMPFSLKVFCFFFLVCFFFPLLPIRARVFSAWQLMSFFFPFSQGVLRRTLLLLLLMAIKSFSTIQKKNKKKTSPASGLCRVIRPLHHSFFFAVVRKTDWSHNLFITWCVCFGALQQQRVAYGTWSFNLKRISCYKLQNASGWWRFYFFFEWIARAALLSSDGWTDGQDARPGGRAVDDDLKRPSAIAFSWES